ncbi:MAG TPA: ATP-binding protein [Pyrinomonadaceae bacterium]|nr:ATP-binding protein [Pyrinomonadaceae bacterium]
MLQLQEKLSEAEHPFADFAVTPANHFKLYIFATVAHVLEQVAQSFDTFEAVYEQFPFLEGYAEELEERAPAHLACTDARGAAAWWQETIGAWEAGTNAHLPLRALRETAALDHAGLTLLMCAGLIEEDSRFGLLFETMQGTPGQHRPNVGLLSAWWRAEDDYTEVRARLRQLHELGLLEFTGMDAPRTEWTLHAAPLLWDVLRGETRERLAPWARYHAPQTLAALDALILPASLRAQLEVIPALLASGEARALVVRGPHHNGRRTLAGAVARALGRGVLELTAFDKTSETTAHAPDERSRLAGTLATLLSALPVFVFDIAPGDTVELPPMGAYDGALALVLGKQGGVRGEAAERALTVLVETPDRDARRLHWLRALGTHATSDIELISERFRLTGGNIRRAATLAIAYAALAGGRPGVTIADVQQASRALNRQMLDTLAVRINTTGDWSHLAASTETFAELRNLESRCRHREQLPAHVGDALACGMNTGVRALFSGASGTGKTLAARLLAASLQMDLYRLDLSTVVNKYIGETEKNLNQIFALAEELDVILLLDEGDALLTQRTDVGNANDRYANLETNYLLQRLESYEGIIIVTTNASDRIDTAFQRRMDVSISFTPPDSTERWAIWQLHLPHTHRIEARLLDEAARRCELTGGQIRNAVLHASSLALADGGTVTSEHFEAAVRREYRKAGAVCPLQTRRDTNVAASFNRW